MSSRSSDTFVLNGWAACESAWDLCKFPRDRIFSYIEELDGAAESAVESSAGAVLVGWSMGATMALSIAARHPGRIRGLVLLAATPRMMKDEGWAGMSQRRLDALLAGLRLTRAQGFYGPQEGRPNPYMMDSDENLQRGIGFLRTVDIRKDVEALAESGALECPVYIFQSERDGIVSRENALYLHGIFKGSSMVLIPGTEHALPVSIPEKIDEAVRRAWTLAGRRGEAD